ncbi:MAG: hypothetical protein DRN04_13490 [Thermoprotei archaeon]|nr:MAG: hypothetical protein DRN04_13490 [Thermoprotei archaeon]
MGWFEISLNDSDVSNKVFSFRVEKELNKLEKGFLTVKEDLDVKYGDKVTIKYKWDEAGTVYERLLFEGFVTTIRRNYIRKLKEISCVGHGYKLLLRAINVSFVNADLNDIVSYVMNEVYGSQYSLDIDNNDTYPAEKTWDTNEDFETWSLTNAVIHNGYMKVYPEISGLTKTEETLKQEFIDSFEGGLNWEEEINAGTYSDVYRSTNYPSDGEYSVCLKLHAPTTSYLYVRIKKYFDVPFEGKYRIILDVTYRDKPYGRLYVNEEKVKALGVANGIYYDADYIESVWIEYTNVSFDGSSKWADSDPHYMYVDYVRIYNMEVKIRNIPSFIVSVKLLDASDNLLEELTPENGEVIINLRNHVSADESLSVKVVFVREDGVELDLGTYTFSHNEIWEVNLQSVTGTCVSPVFGPSNLSSWDKLDVQGSWESLTAYVLDEADNVLGTYTSFPADISSINADKVKVKLEITASAEANSVDLVKLAYLTGGLDISYNTSAKEVIRNACEMFVRDWWFDPSTLHVKTFRGTDYSGSIVFDGNNIVDFQLEENVFEYGNKIVLHYNGGTVVKQDDNSISTYGTIEKVYYNKDINTQEIAETYADYLLSLSLSKKTLHVEVVPEHEFLKTLDVGDQVSVQYADINEKFRIVKMFYEKKVGEEKLSFVLNKAFQDFYALLEKVRNAERWSL